MKKTRILLNPLFFLLASSLLYFSPYLLGSFEFVQNSLSQRIRTNYSAETGVVVILAIVSIVIGILAYPRNAKNFDLSQRTRWESRVLTVFLLGLGAYTVSTPEMYFADKAEVLEATNRGHLLFYVTCSIGFVYSVVCGVKTERLNLIISVVGLLFILFIGHRSALAIAILAIAYYLLRNQSTGQIRALHVLIGIVAFFALAMYKSIYAIIKAGLYEQAIERVAGDGYGHVASLLVGMEQFLIFLHLDYVVSSNYTPECSNIWLIPVSVVPFADSFVDVRKCTFTDQIQPMFFAEFSGGVGANIWAEFFAYFGFVGIPLLVAVIGFLAWLIEAAMTRISSPMIKVGLMIALMHLTFYIQRKELFGAFISAKRVVMIALLIYLLAVALKFLFGRQTATAYAARDDESAL